VLPAEHLLDFAGVDVALKRVERSAEILLDRLPRLGPLDQHPHVVGVLTQRLAELPVFFETAAALEDLLRVGLVVPEVGGGRQCFYLGKLGVETGDVKDSSGDRLPS
jgi:hypothetical protein